MSDPRKEDILDLLNKTWSPCCTTALGLGQLTAFGNTPPVDLFKDLDMGKKLDVLLIHQADLLHIMKTIAAMNHYKDGIERKSVPDEITIRFVNKPAVIARNAFIFNFLDNMENKTEDMEYLWNIWFNCLLSAEDDGRLHDDAIALGDEDEEIASQKDENASKIVDEVVPKNDDDVDSKTEDQVKSDEDDTYISKDDASKRKWKFVDKNTGEHAWGVLGRCIYTDDHFIEHRESTYGEDLFSYKKHTKQHPDVSRRYATKWPYKRYGKFRNEVQTWNEHGVLVVGNNDVEDAVWPNPLMYREYDVYLAVQRDLCPFAAFCPVKSDAHGIDTSLTEACFTEFVKTVKDFREMLKQVKIQVDFEVGETLEYLSTHLEKKYDLIHTSIMADEHGLINTLLCSGPLLKSEKSVLITTTEEHVYVPRKDYITSQTGCKVNMLPTFLGVQIAENLTLGQSFIGKDSPIQTYRWVKCSEPDSVKVSLIDSPELFGDCRSFFTAFASSDFCSAMSLATAFKRFQERITDSPEFIMDNIIKDILPKAFLKSFLLVCKIIGIFPSKSLRIVKAKLDASGMGITEPWNLDIEETIYKTERLFLTQPSLFSSFITDKYETDTYYCDDPFLLNITLLMEEEDYEKMLEYDIHCASNPDEITKLSDMVEQKTIIELDEVKPETGKTEQIFVREQIESYIVTLDFHGDLLEDSPTVVFDKRPCRVSVGFTYSNGEKKIPITLNCQLTSEFHNINVDKSTRQINVTLYKECLQKLGTHLLPLSTIDFDSTKPCSDVKRELRGVLNEIEDWSEFLPSPFKESYMDFSAVRMLLEEKVFKKGLAQTENVISMRSICNEQMFIKLGEMYVVDGYPVVDVTFHVTEDDDAKAGQFVKMAVKKGWKFTKTAFGMKRANMFNYLKMLLLMNSRRMPQSSLSDMPECYRSFLDLRFSDFDENEAPKSKMETIRSNFSGSALCLDSPGLYQRCCYCMKYGTDLLLCTHCDESAYYCNDKCKSADFKKHNDLITGADRVDKKPSVDNTAENECKACGKKTAKAKACSQCKEVYYCNRKCQENDWGNHKASCKKPNSTQNSTDPSLKYNLLKAFGTKQQSDENSATKGNSSSSNDEAGGDIKPNRKSQGKPIGVNAQENVTQDKENIGATGDCKISSAQSKCVNNGAKTDINHNHKSLSDRCRNVILPNGSIAQVTKMIIPEGLDDIGASGNSGETVSSDTCIDNDCDYCSVRRRIAQMMKTGQLVSYGASRNSGETVEETKPTVAKSTTSSVQTSIQCANCAGKVSSTITCTVCSTVSYCGYQCQLTHWPQHHKQCVKHLLLKLSDTL